MNDASAGMKDWRIEQSESEQVPPSPVPDSFMLAAANACAGLWREAQAISNSALYAVPASWLAEREAAECLGQEYVKAFDEQSVRLKMNSKNVLC
jgi:colicin import membrane protein